MLIFRMIRINVNSRTVELVSTMNIDKFLLVHNHDPEKVVISVNNTILQPADYPKTFLYDGDRLELMAFIGGG